MDARTALVLALLSGGSAAGLVALDTAYTLTARLETFDGDAWRVVAIEPPGEGVSRAKMPFDSGCAGPELRLVVDNHRPIPAAPLVSLYYSNYTTPRTTLLGDEPWSLPAFAQRDHSFRIPGEAFQAASVPGSQPGLRADAGVHVYASVAGLQLGACVQEEP